MRKIAVVTGSRSEYGILRPVIKAIEEARGLWVEVVVTGSHLAPEFGMTVRDVEADGFRVGGRLETLLSGDSLVAMAKSFGIAVFSIADCLQRLRPDIVLLEGDRSETLAAAVAAVHLGLVVAHMGGGDTCLGGLDESFRHAITKLAHIHFPATEAAAARIIRMGERKEMVFVVGEPALDVALGTRLLSKREVYSRLGTSARKGSIVVLQHPVTTQVGHGARQMRATLRALEGLGLKKVVIYPNADAGSRAMISVIESYRKRADFFVVQSVSHVEYLSLLKHATALVGNSSSGLIEAPSFRIPVINVGRRQLGREAAENVINVANKAREIRKALDRALHDEEFRRRVRRCRNPYGDGRASERIVKVLKSVEITPDFLQKRLTY